MRFLKNNRQGTNTVNNTSNIYDVTFFWKKKPDYSIVPATKEAIRALTKKMTVEEYRDFMKNATPEQEKAISEIFLEDLIELGDI